MKNSVIINYRNEPESQLDNLAAGVLSCLTGNTRFTNLDPWLTRLSIGLTTYKAAKEKCVTGGTTDTATKNVAKDELTDGMHDLAMEVNRQADGNLVMLQSSGFRLAKIASTKGQLPKPTGLKVVSGPNSGEFVCIVDANYDATMYIFFIAPVPAPASMIDWRQNNSSVRKKTIVGLTPGTQYVLRCAYQGTHPDLVYSDPITIYAQ